MSLRGRRLAPSSVISSLLRSLSKQLSSKCSEQIRLSAVGLKSFQEILLNHTFRRDSFASGNMKKLYPFLSWESFEQLGTQHRTMAKDRAMLCARKCLKNRKKDVDSLFLFLFSVEKHREAAVRSSREETDYVTGRRRRTRVPTDGSFSALSLLIGSSDRLQTCHKSFPTQTLSLGKKSFWLGLPL